MKSRDHTAYIPDGRWYQCRMQFIYDSIRDFMRCALEHTHTNLYHRQYFALDPDWKRAVPSHSPQSTIHITNNSSRIKFAFSYQQFQAYCIHSELAVFSIAISLYLLKMRHVKRLWINLQTFMHKKCFFFFCFEQFVLPVQMEVHNSIACRVLSVTISSFNTMWYNINYMQ